MTEKEELIKAFELEIAKWERRKLESVQGYYPEPEMCDRVLNNLKGAIMEEILLGGMF